jgi:hypothetical protein
MNKIPVGQTIRFAYAFTFGEIGTVIGLIWIPTLINAVASFFVLGSYYRTLADSFESGLPPVGPEIGLPFLLAFLSMLLMAMIGVAITQQALGLRQGPAFAHIALGSAELRAFGGFFGLYLLLVLFVIVVALAVGIAAAGGGAATTANPTMAAPVAAGIGLAALIGLLVVIYIAVRLSFLLIPSVVDGGEFGLTRSWQLTKGNFWRIFAVGLATLLPIMLVFGVVEFVILGPAFFTPDLKPATDTTASLHRMAAQMRTMQAHMPVLMGMSFVVAPLLYGLMFSASAFAYRALSGRNPSTARSES